MLLDINDIISPLKQNQKTDTLKCPCRLEDVDKCVIFHTLPLITLKSDMKDSPSWSSESAATDGRRMARYSEPQLHGNQEYLDGMQCSRNSFWKSVAN